MSSLKIDKEKKIHTRDIKIATYVYDEAHILVEGELNDNRIITNFSHTGELYPPGNIHHMFIRLLIEIESIRIVQVEIEMPVFPIKSARKRFRALLNWRACELHRDLHQKCGI